METNKVKVSVIIPVYNTEKYVREAVESIMHQTIQELEIIIINDGSTDNSLELVKELATKDNRILIYSQTNQGLSMARNAGISYACGKYIYFMDSDDILECDALELCYRKCEKEELDFVFFDALSFFEANINNIPVLNYKRTHILLDKVYTGPDAMKIQLQNKAFTSSVCLNVIKRTFLEKQKLLFYPNIVHEDQLFTTLLYLNAKKTSCIKRSFFNRRIRINSIMTNHFSIRNLNGYFTVTREIINFKQQTSDKNIRTIIDIYLSQMLDSVVWQAYTLPFWDRINLAQKSILKYKRYVSTKSIGTLLFKKIVDKHKLHNAK